MKILRLNLQAFGPFTDTLLDFDVGAQGLHVVYGPNEAGKSSALRALRQLLFGIDHQTSDNFRHVNEDLRVGGAFRRPDGSVLECVRLKKNTNPLRALDGETRVDPEQLAALLVGVDQESFFTRFGIDYQELVNGGKELAEGNDVGSMLFAAAAGDAKLASMQSELASSADGLFKPNSKILPLNAALSRFKADERAVALAQISGVEWLKHHDALTGAIADRQTAQDRLISIEADRGRLARIQEAQLLLPQRNQLLEELQSLADAPELPREFSEQRRKLNGSLAAGEATEKSLTESLNDIADKLKSLVAPTALLARTAEMSDLQDRLGGYTTAVAHRPLREAERRQLQTKIGELLRELGRDASLNDVERLRVPRQQKARIQELSLGHAGLVQTVGSAREALAKLERQRNQLTLELRSAPSPPGAGELRSLTKRIGKRGDLERQAAAIRAELRQKRRQTELELSRLRPWSGTLEELESLVSPFAETIDRFDRELDEAAAGVRDSRRALDDAQEQLRNVSDRLEQFRLEQDVPTEEYLAEARERRDAGWRLVRAAWEQGEAVEEELAAYLVDAPPGSGLGGAYEARVKTADELADRLRREAEQVSCKAQLVVDRNRLEQRRAVAEQALASVCEVLDNRKAAWNAAWQETNLAPLSPQEMRTWQAKQAGLVVAAGEIRSQENLLQNLESEIAALQAELKAGLPALGEAPPAVSSLADLLLFCEETCARLEEAAKMRGQFERDLAKLDAQLPESRENLADAEGQLARWTADWSESIKPLELREGATPTEANAMLRTIDEILVNQHEAENLRERIQGIDRDNAEFSQAVAKTAAKLAPDLQNSDPASAVRALAERVRTAQTTQARRDELLKRQVREQEKFEAAKHEAGKLRAQLAGLCREAGCASPEELPALEARAARRREVQERLDRLNQQLLKMTAGNPLEQFLTEVAVENPDELAARLARLEVEAAELDAKKTQLSEQIGDEGRVLKAMNGVATAAEAEEGAQAQLAEIQSLATKYARLKLASVVLGKTVERYRQRHQGPVLARASDLFAQFTLGSFAGLKADYNDNGHGVLVGTRPGGKRTVATKGMSDGTCDQLYLALRLASLEEYLRNNPPLPFIVDDILIKFDDARAVAALKALAELSRLTQVIFFTHHAHLVTLAKEHLAPDVLFVSQLESSPLD